TRPVPGRCRAPTRPRRPARLRVGQLMFTGIVEELGSVRSITPNAGGARFVFESEIVLDDVELGASIAVNGCCLTVTAHDETTWSADAVIETLARTNLGDLAAGDGVNLEPPVP